MCGAEGAELVGPVGIASAGTQQLLYRGAVACDVRSHPSRRTTLAETLHDDSIIGTFL